MAEQRDAPMAGYMRPVEWRVVTDKELAEFLDTPIGELIISFGYNDVANGTVATPTAGMNIIDAVNAILEPSGLQAFEVHRGEGGFRAECLQVPEPEKDEDRVAG